MNAKLRELLKKHPAPWRTGGTGKSDPHYLREVRDATGDGIAWCGGIDGVEVAAAIVATVNEAVRGESEGAS